MTISQIEINSMTDLVILKEEIELRRKKMSGERGRIYTSILADEICQLQHRYYDIYKKQKRSS